MSEQRAYFEEKLSELSGFGRAESVAVLRAACGGRRKGYAQEGGAEISFAQEPEDRLVRPRRDAGLDARGNEGHQAQERRFPDP